MTTKARRAALLDYAVRCRDAMRLQAWDLDVTDHSPDSDAAVLEIVIQPRRHRGAFRVGTFFTQDAEEQRQTVAHELLHLVQAHLWDEFVQTADEPHRGWRGPLAPGAITAIERTLEEQLERHADFIARLIAPTLPLPPNWPG